MSVRKAVRTMTGTPYRKAPEIVLGNVEWGDPQVTIKFGYDTYVSVSDPVIIEEMINDLREAVLHLHGKVIS